MFLNKAEINIILCDGKVIFKLYVNKYSEIQTFTISEIDVFEEMQLLSTRY